MATIDTMRILLVEDNDTNQLLAREIFRRIGITVDVAENGEVALARLAATNYDLVLMDILMPVMDGYAATQRIRADSRHARLPIVAMTANALAEERDRCIACGMNDFIAKPFRLDALRAIVAKWAGLGVQNQEAAAARPEPTAAPDLVVLDQEVGLAYVEGNRSLYLKLAQNFASKQADAAQRVRAAWQAGDREGARRIAHSLKGMAGTLGARQLTLAATELEQALTAGEAAGDERIGELIECFSDSLQAVLAALLHLSP